MSRRCVLWHKFCLVREKEAKLCLHCYRDLNDDNADLTHAKHIHKCKTQTNAKHKHMQNRQITHTDTHAKHTHKHPHIRNTDTHSRKTNIHTHAKHKQVVTLSLRTGGQGHPTRIHTPCPHFPTRNKYLKHSFFYFSTRSLQTDGRRDGWMNGQTLQ